MVSGPKKEEAPAWDRGLYERIPFPGFYVPGRGVIHPASLSEAGGNDLGHPASKPLPPHSPSGIGRHRNALAVFYARPVPAHSSILLSNFPFLSVTCMAIFKE